ncbi:MAG: N-acetylmuramoyl-L-alanine amidase [Gemmatimonadota bacterium]
MPSRLNLPLALSLLALSACGSSRAPGGAGPSPASGANGNAASRTGDSSALPGLPPVAEVDGPLRINVVYPAPGDLVDAKDSSFLFGSVGNGKAKLSINGQLVRVWPNGAWLAWLAIPPDSIMTFTLEARTPTDSASLTYAAHRTRRFQVPATPVWIDSLSIVPRGRVWWPAGEYLPVSVRAAQGATVRIRLSDGRTIPLLADPHPEAVPSAVRAFDRDTLHLAQPVRADRYSGILKGTSIGSSLGPVVGRPFPATPLQSCEPVCVPIRLTPSSAPTSPAGGIVPDSTGPVIEAILGADTARVRWPVQLTLLDSLPVLTELNDDTAHVGNSDSLTVGRARPGATYNWFFPTGTRAMVSGRIGDDLRLHLSNESDAWVNVADAQPLPAGLPALRATVGSATLTPLPDRLVFRIPLTERVPYAVSETERGITLRFYSAVGDVDWIRYGGTDPYVQSIIWSQPSSDVVTFDFALTAPVWGYRAHWRQNDLIFEIHRPPTIDAKNPLKGRRIVVDPGHPPAGATGPTGYREAEANLAVALVLRDLLRSAGAEVIMTRTSDSSVDLWPRVHLADTTNADLLLSIHNNALPDGVNPFTNNGSSVFYNQPRSAPLAFAIQRALVRRLGLRDLGVGRGDLALVRPTWMPSALSEGLFMSLPDQEAALRSPEGRRRYAQGVFEGVEGYLSEVAGGR